MSIHATATRPNFGVRAGETALSTAAFLHLQNVTAGTPAPVDVVAGAAALAATLAAPSAAAPVLAPAAGSPALAPGAAAPAPAGQERHESGKFKKAEDDDADDDDEEGDDKSDEDEILGTKGKKKASARKRERARCKAIFTSAAAAGGNMALASHFAFGTNMSRSQAIGALAVAPPAAAGGSSLNQAMGGYPNAPIGPGAGGEPPTSTAIASSWDRAVKGVQQDRTGGALKRKR